jgi:type IV secretion system protein VirD4
MLVAGLFGLVPATLVGLEIATVAAKVIEPLAAYVRAHPNTGSGPTWYGQVGPTWHRFTAARDALPWIGWPSLWHHPHLMLGSLVFGAAFGAMLMMVAARARYLHWGGPTSSGKGQYGSAHWRPSGELGQSNAWWQAPKQANPDSRRPPRKGAITITLPPLKRARAAAAQPVPVSGLLVAANDLKKPTAGWILERDEHALVMAITRAGKTRRVILPSIGVIGLAAQDSLVITDPKGEIYEYTAEWLRAQGYRIVRFDLIEPQPGRSQQFNPMSPVNAAMDQQHWAQAAEAARDIAHLLTYGGPSLVNSEPIWINGQIGLLTALILYVADKAPDGAKHLGSVLQTLLELGEDEGAGLSVAMGKLPTGHPAKTAYGAVKLAKDKTLASFLTSAAAALNIFADPQLVWLTAQDTVDFHALGQADGPPTALFLEIPHEKKTRYPIASLAVNQVFRQLTEVARQHDDTRLPRKVAFLLDEFGNMPQFPDFDQFITVSAGMGMRLVMVLQNLEQLKKHYQDTERTIRGNAGTWLFLRTSDLQSAEELAKITGQYTLQTESLQKPHVSWLSMNPAVGNTSEGQSLAGRDLVRPDEFLRWPPDWVWHWQAGYAPAMLPLPDLSAWPCFQPIHQRHPFHPWDSATDAWQVALWNGIDAAADGEDDDRPKGGEKTVQQPEIQPTESLMVAFGQQLAPIDPNDVSEC